MERRIWRDGEVLVVPDGGVFPDACVICNEPVEVKKEQTFYWHHPALYLLVPLGLLVYAVVALVVRKKATVEYGLCHEHRARRNRNIAIAWLGVALGIVVPIAVAASHYVTPPWLPNPWIIGICLVLASAIWGVVAATVLRPVGIDPNVARFKGAGERFLSTLESAPSTTPATIPGAARIS